MPEPTVTETLTREVDALRALARRLVGSSDAAADLVQDTCVAALHAPAPPAPTLRWLATILRNVLRQRARSGARRRKLEAQHAEQRMRGAADGSPAHELATHRQLVDDVAALPAELRDVLFLHFWRGLSVTAIAAAAGLPRTTVQGRLERAVDALRRRLQSRDPDWRRAVVLLAAPLRPAAAACLTMTGAMLMKTHSSWLVAGTVVLALGGVLWLAVPPAASPPPVASSHAAASAATADAGTTGAGAMRELATAEAPVRPPDAPSSPAPLLHGTVLDVAGVPIADVDVVFAPTTEHRAAGPAVVVARSGTDGAFAAPVPVATGWLGVQSPSWAAVRRAWYAPGAEDHERIVLVAPSRDYTGVVVGADHQPVEGARVVVDVGGTLVPVRATRGTSVALPHDLAATDTGAGGAFVLRGVGWLDGARLRAVHPPFAAADVPLPPHSRGDLVLQLGPTPEGARLVHGVVVDAHGTPVENATVAVGGKAVRSARDGTFAAPWEWRRPGFVRAVAPSLGAATSRLEPGAGRAGWSAAHPLIVQLPPAPLAVHGRVVDAAGAGVAGVRVWTPDLTFLGIVTSSHDGHELSGEASVEELGAAVRERLSVATTSGADGTFTLPGLLPREYALFALDPATLRAAGPVQAAPGGSCELRLPAEELRRVAGVVVARDGTPLAGVVVQAGRTLAWQRPARDPDPWEGCMMVPLGAAALAAEHRAVTDADGRFVLSPMATRDAYLTFRGDAVMLGASQQLDPDVAADALRVVVDARSCFRVVLASGQDADAFSIVGPGDAHVTTLVRVESYEMSVGKVTLADGTSPLVFAAAGDVTLVLWRGDREVARRAAQLRAGGPHELRL